MDHNNKLRSLLVVIYSIFLIIVVMLLKTPSKYFILYFILLIGVIVLWEFLDLSNSETLILIYFTAVSLQLGYSLVGDVLNGTDIYGAYRYGLVVVKNSKWDPYYSTFSHNFVLPIVMWLPMLTKITGIPLVSLLKTIPNFVYSMTYPLLYIMLTKTFRDKDASFYGTLTLLIFPFHWQIAPTVVRQEIAMFLLFLLIYLTIIRKNLFDKSSLKVVTFLITIGVILSHYSTTIVYYILGAIWYILFKFLSSSTHPKNCGKYLGRQILYILLIVPLIWVLWYMLLWKTYVEEGTAQTLFKIFSDIYRIWKISGAKYVTSYGMKQHPSYIPILFLSVMLLLGGGISCIYLILKSYKNQDIKILSYSITALISVLIPTIGYIGALGIIRTTGMILFLLSYPIGFVFSIFKKRLNCRFLPVIIGSLIIIIYSGALSLYLYHETYNPEISTLSESTIPKTWSTFGEFYGSSFLGTHIAPSNISVVYCTPYKDFIKIIASYDVNIKFLYFYQKQLQRESFVVDNSFLFIRLDLLRYSIIWERKWTSSGVVFYKKNFSVSLLRSSYWIDLIYSSNDSNIFRVDKV